VNTFRFFVLGAAVLALTACGGKSRASPSTTKLAGAGVAQVRAALEIFERAGFHNLVVYSNVQVVNSILDSQKTTGRSKALEVTIPPAQRSTWGKQPPAIHPRDFDWIYARGYSNSLTAPFSATWWKTMPPKLSPEKLQRLVAAEKKVISSIPGRKTRDQLRTFDLKRLTYARVCNHWTVMSYDSGSDPTLRARVQRAISELRKIC